MAVRLRTPEKERDGIASRLVMITMSGYTWRMHV
jgi:hypothetical protein